MKRSVAFILLICCTGFLHAQINFTKEEQAVQQTIIQAFNALSDKDSVALKNQCTADVKFYEYGKTWNIDSLINLAIAGNNAPDFKRTNKIDFVNTTISGNTAWATYNLYSEITTNGKNISIHWMETEVLILEQDKWKIKLLHSTLVKRS